MWSAICLFVLYAADSIWKVVLFTQDGFNVTMARIPWWALTGALIIRFFFMGFLLYAYLRMKKTSADTS